MKFFKHFNLINQGCCVNSNLVNWLVDNLLFVLSNFEVLIVNLFECMYKVIKEWYNIDGRIMISVDNKKVYFKVLFSFVVVVGCCFIF